MTSANRNGANSGQQPSEREQVAHYYGQVLKTNKDLVAFSCCGQVKAPDVQRNVLKQLPQEIMEKSYGCGACIPPALEKTVVLDLGCGTGSDAYVCSALVGPEGKVIGVDMLESSLQIAKKFQAQLAEKLLGQKSNVEFKQAYIEDLASADIAEKSCDIVISNCVVNLIPNKEAVLRQVFRALRDGGEFYFSDKATRRDKRKFLLFCECLGGALYLEDFRQLCEKVGFKDVRLVESHSRGYQIEDDNIRSKLGDTQFFHSLELSREDYGESAQYRGTLTECPDKFVWDMEMVFPQGKWISVDGNTAEMLRKSRYSKHFHLNIVRAEGIREEYTKNEYFTTKGDKIRVNRSNAQYRRKARKVWNTVNILLERQSRGF
eukprot:jgi/Galph1/3298/GphlegSOOS_G1973.1